MTFFESMLSLLLVAIVFLQFSRKFLIPYPTMLAIAGVIVAAVPWAPKIGIDPELALALFIAPVLFDAAYDLPPRTLRQNWLPLVSLAAIAVILTTAAVAFVGVTVAGLPLAAAIALGAIVAPPDAAAATAMLERFNLPRQTYVVLKGESLLNDAVSLLIFSAAVAAVASPSFFASVLPLLAFAVPGGLIFGYLAGRAYMLIGVKLAGTLGGTLLEFVATFGTWIIAEHLHLSAILAIVAYAMVIARYMPERQSARHRIHSYSVWEAAVFLLNVLAFLLMGLQARQIFLEMEPDRLTFAITVAIAVFITVVVVRMLWELLYNRTMALFPSRHATKQAPTLAMSLVAGWCGMRGLVTLATALALPFDFPSRDIILLSALAVVLGTLIIQGLTLGPLIHFLRFEPDHSWGKDLSQARVELIETALKELETKQGKPAKILRDVYASEREIARGGEHPREVGEMDELRRNIIAAKREKLAEMRRADVIDDDMFHILEQELDWAELAASSPESEQIVEG